MIASETGLWRLDLVLDRRERVATLLVDPDLRSNDGCADPWGGFWIGAMGKRSQQEAGAIWRHYRGEVRKLYPGITIPHAICFDAGRSRGYFADTQLKKISRVRLDADGWPAGEPERFVDLGSTGLSPDGAVTDERGNLWNAQWGSHRVACYAPDGREIAAERFDAARISWPAFGGADFDTLFAISSFQSMTAEGRQAELCAGMTFARRVGFRGVAEPRVILG